MSNEPKNNFEKIKQDLTEKLNNRQESIEDKAEVNSEAEVVPSTSESTAELSEIEKQAHALGWRPKGDYAGNHFVPADEYVRRQPLFERIDRQGQELRELKTMNQQIASHLSSLRKEAYDQALKDLESRRIQSINDGDSSQVLNAERQMRDIEQRRQNDVLIQQEQKITQAQDTQVHPEAMSFQERNGSWYNTNTSENRRMMEAAMLVDKQLAEQAQERGMVLNPKEHLKMVEESVRRNFPHRFENPKKEAPAMVGRSTSSKEGTKTNTLVARLSPEQLRIGEVFQRSNKDYTLEKYAADLEKMGRLRPNN